MKDSEQKRQRVIINSIQLQNMQTLLEMEHEISFSCEDKSQSTTAETKASKQSLNIENKQNIHLKVLKENIQNQEKDKIRNKYEKELQIKNDQIFTITRKLQKVEQQLAKTTALVNKLSTQNELEKQKNKDLGREIQKYKNKQKQKESKQPTPAQITQMKRLQQENSELRNKIAQIEKENKIIVRRLINQSEETKKSLQGKLQVKNKQQIKVQELLQKKKQELAQVINEKDHQITEYINKITSKDKSIRQLNECLQESKIKYTKLQTSLSELAQRNKNEYDIVRQKNEMLKAQLVALQTTQSQYELKIVTSLQSFQKKFEPNCTIRQPLQILDNLKQLIITKLQQEENQINKLQKNNSQLQKKQTQMKQNIYAQQQQIKKLTSTHKQAQAKIDRMQQELKYLKQRENNTVNFADIIREHLQNRQESVKKEEEHSQKKEADCKLKYKVTYDPLPQKRQISSQINKTLLRSNSQQMTRKQIINTRQSFLTRKLQNQKNIQKSAQTQLIDLKKEQYDTVMSQLSHKKQSLIFLMYQAENNKQITPPIAKKNPKTSQPKSLKKRSSSMSELVRQRCQSNTLNVHDTYNI